MISYPHEFELRIGKAIATQFEVRAEIIADEYQRGEWTIGTIEAECLVDIINGDGEDDWTIVMVDVPDSHPLYQLIMSDLLENCSSDIAEAWGHHLNETRDDARLNAAENKSRAMAAE